MFHSTRIHFLAGAILALGLAAAARADGFIIVHPPRPEVRVVPLAVKSHDVKVTIEGQVAVTTVDQVFYNPNPMQLEGTYIFPIPEGAGIENLSLWIEGVEQKAELLDRDKARNIYEGIVRQMKDPALLEYVGRRAFKLRVFPIPPRGDRRVKLSYREIVPADGGMARYLYPLNTEKFSSQPLERVVVDVELSSPKPLGNILSLSHRAQIVRKDDHHARITYEAHGVTPDRDFVLHYGSTTKEFGLDVVAYRPGGEDGYALVALSPRQEIESERIQPKDVVLVFDASGSMHGKRFEQATAALSYCVDTLRDGDRFELISFATEARPLFSALRDVNADSRKEAHTYIEKLEPLGGTNIDEALERAQALNQKGDRPFMIVFLTDGLPTIGATTDIEEILKRASSRRADNQRIFAFGVGNDVNTDLLDRLSGENRGTRTYVGEAEDIEVAVGNLWQKVASPVLTGVTLTTAGGATFTDTYPRTLPDLFHGVQLVVTTRYQGVGPTAIRLRGKVGGEAKEFVYECSFPAEETRNDYLPRLWAVRKVGYLLDEIHIHGENKELVDEVVRLSKKHGIMTPYTSYLVIEDRPTASTTPRPNRLGREPLEEALARSRSFGGEDDGDEGASGPMDSLRRAFDMAEGKKSAAPGTAGARGGGGAPAPSADPAEREEAERLDLFAEDRDAGKGLAANEGVFSVRASKFIDRLKEAQQSGDQASSFMGNLSGAVQHVGDLTFYRQGQGWVQAEVYDLEGKPEIVTVQAFTDAYFALLTEHPECARILALGAVCFLADGKVVLVSE